MDYGNLFAYMGWNKISRKKLQTKAGLSDNTMTFLHLEIRISMNDVLKICEAFNLSPYEISEDLQMSVDELKTAITKAAVKDGNRIRTPRSDEIKTIQCDLDGNPIATYSGRRDASRKTGVNHGGIIMCCNKKRKTAGGFTWTNE